VALSPDGSLVAVAGDFPDVWLLDLASGRPARALVPTYRSHLMSLAFSLDQRRLVLGSGTEAENPGNLVTVFDVASGQPTRQPFKPVHSVNSVAMLPDGQRFVVVTNGCNTLLHRLELDPAETESPTPFPGEDVFVPIQTVLVSGDGQRIYSITGDPDKRDGTGKVITFSVADLKRIRGTRDGPAYCTATLSADDRLLAAGRMDGSVDVWGVGPELGGP
jgi:WD40 repeat protein